MNNFVNEKNWQSSTMFSNIGIIKLREKRLLYFKVKIFIIINFQDGQGFEQ